MSELQPWRNPRTSPYGTATGETSFGRLRAWWPAVAWACIIFTLSTDSFSSEHTANILSPVVQWLFPHLTQDQFDFIHHIIRKSAHFTEYFIFCLLIYRGVRGDRKGWRWTWGISALAVSAGYSIMDEIHQAFVTSRTASPYDSLLDSIGAFFAFAALWLWFFIRSRKSPSLQSETCDTNSTTP